jgi:curli production assembly/transport component CsgG
MRLTIILFLTAIMLAGCVTAPKDLVKEDPTLSLPPLQKKFNEMPQLDGKKITIAVYSFSDKTGQRKPSEKFSQLSSAVTQGAESWVIQSLKEVGDGTWFEVVERVGLDNLIKERQLIRSTREQYNKEKDKQLKPLKFAGLLVEGGVVGYDSNIATGGSGARYFGIGANTQYRLDNVTVAMRIVSVSTGEVLLTVAVEKTIASIGAGADVFRFLDMGTRALELETGYTTNEPVNYAVRAAINQAVVELIIMGEEKGLWEYKKSETSHLEQQHKGQKQ